MLEPAKRYPPQPGYAARRWTRNDSAFVRRELLDRLFSHRLDIEFGFQPDLRAAVRAAGEKAVSERARSVAKVKKAWLRKHRSFTVNRRRLLASTPVCTYCGAPATSADHIVSRARGGSDALSNLTSACGPCNSEKGKFSLAEWQEWRACRGRCWPPLWRQN